MHSQGRVLGDRSVLYKYLNPNLVVVIAEGEAQETSSSQKGPVSFFNIYLIDSVTGHMVFHAHHKRAKGPIHVVHSENWVIVSYLLWMDLFNNSLMEVQNLLIYNFMVDEWKDMDSNLCFLFLLLKDHI